jgi:adenine deaminase
MRAFRPFRHREELARAIAQGAGREPADLVIRNIRLFDLVTGALTPSDIAICGPRIVGTHARYAGRREIDGAGRIAVPGFVDTHLHVESSLVTPGEFDRMVLPHGVTTALCDPHEIANVLGAPGIAWMLDWAEVTALDLFVNLSSCVPATHLETAGASLSAADLLALRGRDKALGLAEVMNFPGVISAIPDMLEKLSAFSEGHIDGHGPLLSDQALNAYLAAGIRTDHEATSAAEAREKLAKGMIILIREGSVSKDLHALAPVLTQKTAPFCAFCTDDRNPLDIAEEGHLDFMIREAVRLGVPPLAAYRAASWSGANAFGLADRGLIAPGWRADIALVGDLAAVDVSLVIAGGRVVDDALFAARRSVASIGLGSVRSRRFAAADFRLGAIPGETSVIGVNPGKIITDHRRIAIPASGGERRVDTGRDLLKVAVIERHGRHGGHATGFVQGFGLQRGAIGSSVGHDSHNLCLVGANERAMAVAANRLVEIGGGFVVADEDHVLAELPLPIAGLISPESHETVRETLKSLRQAARDLGATLAEPFLQVAFLPLPVIPHLKITDRGLVDVDRFDFITQG